MRIVAAWIALALPLRDRGRLPQVVGAVEHQLPDQRSGEALAHRPAGQARRVIDPVRVAFGNDPAAPGDGERRGERLGRIERGLDRLGKLCRIDVRGQRRRGQQIAHRPGLGRGIRQRGVKPPRREEHIVAPARQDHAALVGELPGGARHPVRQREAHAARLPVHLRRACRAPRLRWFHEGTVLLDRRREAAPGNEQHRTQQFGETRGLQFDRIAWRNLPPGRVFLRRSRLRGVWVRNAARDQPREQYRGAVPRGPRDIWLAPCRHCRQAQAAASWALGVEREMASSSSFMSAGISAKSGVLR